MPTTGATVLVDTLVDAGVQRVFSVSGNQILSIYDATIGRPLDIFHTRHEASAVHLADGWGRLTEKPGVALVTAGPGHCNAISALYVAQMAQSPLLLLSGQSPLSQAGWGAFQEMDQVALAQPVCKAAWIIEDVALLEQDVQQALDLACHGRPGPVCLCLPSDVLQTTWDRQPKTAVATFKAFKIEPDAANALNSEKCSDLLNLLNCSSRPLILTGSALSRPSRRHEIALLTKTTGIPMLAMESPRGVNDPALRRAVCSLGQADRVLLLGMKLDFIVNFGQPPAFAPTCRFAQISADKQDLASNSKVDWMALADPLRSAIQLGASTACKPEGWIAWNAQMIEAQAEVPSEWNDLGSRHAPIHPLAICHAVQPYLHAGGILVSDGGEFGQWGQAALDASLRLINGPSGSIGSSISLGLAAKLAHGDRHVFVFQGDGTFGYHPAEFDTALRYGLPIIVIVGNDARWNAEHQLQLRQYGTDRTVACGLLPSRYDLVVEALGGHGEHVEDSRELAPALERAVQSGLPACININIEGAAAPAFGLPPTE